MNMFNGLTLKGVRNLLKLQRKTIAFSDNPINVHNSKILLKEYRAIERKMLREVKKVLNTL